jgi:hypothetical protein
MIFRITISYNVSQRNGRELKKNNHFQQFFGLCHFFEKISFLLLFHITFLNIFEIMISYYVSERNERN